MNEYYILNDTEKRKICWVCLNTDEGVRTMSPEEVDWYQTLTSKTLKAHKLYICGICGHLLKKYIKFAQQCGKASEVLTNSFTSNESMNIPLKPSHNYCTSVIRTVLCLEPSNEEMCDLKSENYFVYQNNDLTFHSNEVRLKNTDTRFSNDARFTKDDTKFTNDDPEFTNNDARFINDDVEFTDNFIEIANNDIMSDDDELPLMLFSKNNGRIWNLKDELIVKTRKKKLKKRNKNGIGSDIKVKEVKSESDFKIQDNCKKVKKTSERDNRQGFSSRMVQETDEYLVIKLTKEQVLQEMTEKSTSEKYKRALYKCDKCVKGFNFEEVLRGHMKKHTQESGELLCDICEQYCPSAVSMRGHMKSHTTRYKCKVCSSVRLSRQHLLEHYALTHTNSASLYNCQHCQFATKKRTVIQRHVRRHTTEEKHACDQCGRLFTNVASLRVHTTRHDKSKALQCTQCSRKFIYPSLLQKHVKAVHEQSEYYCVECDVRFKSPDNLRLHFKKAKKHRDPSSYTHECPQCNQKFISAPSLAVHLTTTHGQPKTHACDLCPRLYSNRESLQGHIRRRHVKKQE